MNKNELLDIFEEINLDDIDVNGSGWEQECRYLWTMCILYPEGCTDPCALYRQHCV